ncbi:MAG: hypothetical protein ABJA78_13590 [Ferruginibacter sp.]
MKKLYFLTGMALIYASNIFAQAYTVTATPVNSTICSNNSTDITANASPVGYSLTAIPINLVPSPGPGATTILGDAGVIGTPITSGNLNDGRWDNVPLPFTFNYYGVDYSVINICTNGWIAMGSTSTTNTAFNVILPSAAAPNASICAIASDLNLTTSTGGTLEYFDDGSFPNRQFYVLYTNAKFFGGTGTVTVEIILKETSNEIEIHTSSCTNTTNNKTQGIENATGTVGVPVTGRNFVTSWAATGIPNAYKFAPDQFTYAWSPATGLNLTTGKTVTAKLAASQTYNVVATRVSDNVTANSNVTITVNPASFTLANTPVAGGSPICQNISVNPTGSTDYRDGNCNLIATILPSGAVPLDNSVFTCVKVDTGATKKGSPDLYGARSYDMEPIANANTATATVTLYYLQSEFNKFNLRASDSNHTNLPTGPADATGISNLIIRQFHGTGTSPGNYTAGTHDDLTSATPGASFTWNSTRSWWEIKVPVTGFSGFYLTSKKLSITPIQLEYLKGSRTAGNNLLEWKVNCTSTEAKFQIERSNDGRHFTSIFSMTASQLRCLQAFNFTDTHPLSGLNYYRINMIDVDGKSGYSGIVALLNKESGFDIINLTPTLIHKETAMLNITAVQKTGLTIIVTDIAGKIVRKQTAELNPGNISIAMNLENLAAGTYQITGYTSSGKSRTIRFVKE